jgi:hypothetical protein
MWIKYATRSPILTSETPERCKVSRCRNTSTSEGRSGLMNAMPLSGMMFLIVPNSSAHFNLTSILAAAPLSHLARPAVGFSWIGCLNGGFGRGLFAGFFRFDINPISSLNWPEGCNGVIDGDLKVDCVAIRCF